MSVKEIGSIPGLSLLFVLSIYFVRIRGRGFDPSSCMLPNNGNLPSNYGRTSHPAKTVFTHARPDKSPLPARLFALAGRQFVRSGMCEHCFGRGTSPAIVRGQIAIIR